MPTPSGGWGFALYSLLKSAPGGLWWGSDGVHTTGWGCGPTLIDLRAGKDNFLAAQIVDICRFKAHEFRPLLEAESHAWSARLRWDYGATARLISTCLEENRLSGYVLVNENRLQGYSFFFCEGEKGLIGNLFVESPLEGFGHSLLLEKVIEKLVKSLGLQRIETQLPHFGFEELQPYFRSYCFEGYLRRFMALSLTNWVSNADLSGAGRLRSAQEAAAYSGDFRLEPREGKHDRAAAQLICETYRNHVDTLINDQYRSLGGVTRLMENIGHQRGCGEYVPEASFVAIHRSTQRLAGVLEITAVRPQTAHIPQIAVAKEFQGAGLGTTLMELSFRELVRRGYQEVTLTVTDLNAGAVRLYERLGFETFATFGAFVWDRPSRS